MSQNQQDAANDGSNAPRPENAHGAGAQQQGNAPQTTDGTSGTSQGQLSSTILASSLVTRAEWGRF